MEIGIAKGLLYYIYYPLWRTFFEKLGCEIIVSDDTNKTILDRGIKDFADDACLPLKLFRGHILELASKSDAIFVPRLVSVARHEYICPKFCGLPEMIKNSISHLPPMIDETLNMHKNGSMEEMRRFFMSVGRHITSDKSAISEAYSEAVNAQRNYDALLRSGFLPVDLLGDRRDKAFREIKSARDYSQAIGIIGHPYVIYDNYLSMGLIDKVRQAGYGVITPENVADDVIEEEADKLPKRMFYTFGKAIYASAMHMIRSKSVRGVVYMSAFGCGVDAFITELVQRRGRRLDNIPIMILNIDEHTGQAGVDTRIEAFLDMIKWRDQHEGDIPAYRQYLHRG